MGLKKIIHKLGDLLDAGEGEKKARKAEAVRQLLDKLDRKAAKLRNKLDAEEDAEARKKLERRLKVALAHAEKAREFLHELNAKA